MEGHKAQSNEAEKLNPSKTLFENESLYNFFPLLPHVTREKAFEYLNQLYQTHVNKTEASPTSKQDQLRALLHIAKNYPWLIIFKMVEIKKMIEEDGFFEFASRESGCLTAFFKGYCETLTNENGAISEKYIKELHLLNTKKVAFEEMKEKDYGNYRREGFEALILDVNDVSQDGIVMLINLIENSPLDSMMISGAKDFSKYMDLQESRSELQKFLKIDTLVIQFAEEFYSVFKNKNFSSNWEKILDQHFSDPEIEDAVLDSVAKGLTPLLNIVDYERIAKGFGKTVNNLEKIKTLLLKYSAQLNHRANLNDYLEALVAIATDPVLMEMFDQFIRTQKLYESEKRAILKTLSEKVELFRNKVTINSKNVNELRNDLPIKSNREFAKHFLERLRSKKNPQDICFIFPSDPKIIQQFLTELDAKLNDQAQKSPQEKLKFIYHYIQLFLLIHPFVDANNRTFLNQLAPELHRRLNLVEPIFFNPFFPYGLSPEEVVEVAKLSCALELALREFSLNGKSLFFNFMEPTKTEEIQIADKIAQQIIPTIQLLLVKNCLLNFNKIIPSQSTFFPQVSQFQKDILSIVKSATTIELILKKLKSLEHRYEREGRTGLLSICQEAQKKIASDLGLDKKEAQDIKPVANQ